MKNFYFDKVNWILFAISLVLLVIGYILMGLELISASSVVLVVAYLVLIPLSFLYRKKDKK